MLRHPKEGPRMDEYTGLFILGLVCMGLMFLFVRACEKV